MEIKRYFLSRSDNTRRKERMDEVEYIVITSSRYNGFSALKNRNVIERIKYKQDKEFSCHYIIDLKGDILSIIPEKEKAICTNNVDIDDKSISIMLTVDKFGKYTEYQIKMLKKLIYKLVKKYKVKEDKVVREYDINNSRRPNIFCDESIILYDIVGIEKR